MDTSKYTDATIAGAMMVIAAATSPDLPEVKQGALIGRGAIGGMPKGSIPKDELEKMIDLVDEIKELLQEFV